MNETIINDYIFLQMCLFTKIEELEKSIDILLYINFKNKIDNLEFFLKKINLKMSLTLDIHFLLKSLYHKYLIYLNSECKEYNHINFEKELCVLCKECIVNTDSFISAPDDIKNVFISFNLDNLCNKILHK